MAKSRERERVGENEGVRESAGRRFPGEGAGYETWGRRGEVANK